MGGLPTEYRAPVWGDKKVLGIAVMAAQQCECTGCHLKMDKLANCISYIFGHQFYLLLMTVFICLFVCLFVFRERGRGAEERERTSYQLPLKHPRPGPGLQPRHVP